METRSDELRIALVLNGGVSLAVWMGGVSFELNRLVRETHPVYRGLLELTRTAARIDVISGTSAGGINGAALALAQIHGHGLYALRDVWLETGGLEQLLHEPDDPELRSLLRGDEWFLPQIRKALAALAIGDRADPALVPVSLTLTTTLLDGEKHVSLDDFGAEIEDKVHRAIWRFLHLPAEDAFGDAHIVDQLAFAARSTASFPVAFDPALYDPQADNFQGAQRLEARTFPPKKLTRKAFLLDGGILDNRPFQAALEAIAKLPAEGNTRRVLAYVVPDPAAQADQRPTTNGVLEPPTLAQAAWRSLVSIPGSQSIASHMAELRAHNNDASSRWKRIFGAVRHMRSDALMTCAAASLGAYKARRVDGIVEYFLEETERGLAVAQSVAAKKKDTEQQSQGQSQQSPQVAVPEVRNMRRATRQWLASTWRDTARPVVGDPDACEHLDALVPSQSGLLPDLARQWKDRLPAHFDASQPALDDRGTWGLYTLQFLAEFTTEVLRRTQRLQALVGRWKDDAKYLERSVKAVVTGPAIPQRPKEPDAADELKLDRQPSEARAALLKEGTRFEERDKPLATFWREAYAIASTIRQRLRAVDDRMQSAGHDGFVKFVTAWQVRGGEQPPLDDALLLLKELLECSKEIDDLDHLARALCTVLDALRLVIEEIVEAHRHRRAGRADIDEAVCELQALQDYLYRPRPGEPTESGDDEQLALNLIAWRVLALEVFEVTAGSRRQSPSAPAEIVQISSRLGSAFGGSNDPAEKLNGMQLAHFGAFYKRSWRANDWTFGRLDGIDRVVRIALNPDALQKIYGNRTVDVPGSGQVPAAKYVEDFLHALAVGTAHPDIRGYLQDLWEGESIKIRSELAWLDQHQTVPPPVLEYCARALTRRLQLETLREEIPEIADSLLTESVIGAPPSREAGAELLVKVAPGGRRPQPPDPELAVSLVKSNLLGKETLSRQVGTDLLTRTVSQGLATAHSAFSSAAGGLNALKALFKITEWPIRIFYWLASRLSQPSSTSAALEAMAYGVGAAIVVVAGMSEKLPATILAFGWALLTGAVATSLLRNRTTGGVLAFAVLATLIILEKATLATVLVVVAVYALLLTPWGAGLAALAVIGLAAWWSAGRSEDAAALLSNKLFNWPEMAAIMLDKSPTDRAKALLELARLELAFWPALLLGLALVLVSTVRALYGGVERARRLGRMNKWGP